MQAKEQTLQEWAENRCSLMVEDLAILPEHLREQARKNMARGYMDVVEGNGVDHQRYAGDPLGLDDYLVGYTLADYEIGPADLRAEDERMAA